MKHFGSLLIHLIRGLKARRAQHFGSPVSGKRNDSWWGVKTMLGKHTKNGYRMVFVGMFIHQFGDK